MPKILLATDLDRTLLDKGSQAPPGCLEAIREFTAAGGSFTIATGRPTRGALRYPELMALVNAPIISYNGGCISDAATREILWQKYLPAGLAPLIRSALDRFPMVGALVFRGPEDVTTVTQPNAYTHEVTWEREHYKTPQLDLECVQEPWNKIVMAGCREDMAHCTDYIRRNARCEITTILSEGLFLEIIAPGIHKGDALRRVAQMLNIDRSHVLAIGDSMNDIEMIQWAQVGGAVANAEPAVAEAADILVPSNDAHGIVTFIRETAMPMLCSRK